ncbi:hypothetical protein KAW43_01665 [Candidatus Parcubacteria bacterium]|nr:hypothetical protein [Candidatus Parcubacteria bacterium]
MKQSLPKKFFKFHLFLFLIFLISFQIIERNSFFISEAEAGADDNVSGWAWSENVGWLSFNSINCDSDSNGITDQGNYSQCSIGETIQPYGVDIDKYSGELSGYAWSEQIAWISFNKGELSGCPSGACEAKIESDDTLSGWARACLVFADGCSGSLKPNNERGSWDGWIKLKGTAAEPPNQDYGIFLDRGVSPFEFQGWVWGSNILGWISFSHSNCDTNGDGFSNGIGSCPIAGTDISDYKVITDYVPNQSPVITSVSDSPDPQEGGGDIIFSSLASDSDVGDTIKLYVCQDALCVNCVPGDTSGCLQDTIGAVVSDIAVAVDPSADYTSDNSEYTNAQNYWAYVCDQFDKCSNIISGGDFTVKKKDTCACGCVDGICDECFGGYCCSGQCKSSDCNGAYAENLELGIINYCTGSPGQGHIELKWIYQNGGGIQQQQFHIQVSTDAAFTDPVVNEYVFRERDPGETDTSGELVKVGGSDILYNDDYYWRVQVKDAIEDWSGWTLYDDAADPDGDGNFQTFTTPVHPYPYPDDFTFTPERPSANEEVQLCSTLGVDCLIDVSICYNDAGETVSCTGQGFDWTIPEAIFTDGGASSENPKIEFATPGDGKVIKLGITDTGITMGNGNCGVGCCEKSKTINVSLPLPNWKEIIPF